MKKPALAGFFVMWAGFADGRRRLKRTNTDDNGMQRSRSVHRGGNDGTMDGTRRIGRRTVSHAGDACSSVGLKANGTVVTKE